MKNTNYSSSGVGTCSHARRSWSWTLHDANANTGRANTDDASRNGARSDDDASSHDANDGAGIRSGDNRYATSSGNMPFERSSSARYSMLRRRS